ncbi:transmembrane protein 69-like [Girardinichthys multiradiatus]|uniref:transmembrane protein 69-like n=1 Tax=Girardinichthys multiradiatus TaxID=208333 RepID=UPI001FAE2715|nr:transmembrane protein 69-like [Girardinichthys multiradiatus]XP_047231266.1 transmembrane protein 69-like [Girardinichthys multiradiatus]
MLSVALRSTIALQEVFLWARPPQRCWTSALRGASVSSSSLLDYSGQTKLSFSPLLQKTQSYNAFSLIRNQYFHSSAVRLKKRAQPQPPSRELDLVRYDMKHLWKGPKPALYLGFAGLIPFISPTLLMAVTESYYPQLAYAQVAYAASIVSFLGGARWGFALPESSPAKPDWINLANSVVPSLLAWMAMLMSDSIVPAASMVIIGLGISLHYDLSLLPTYPSWFKALRTVLSIVAFFSLLGTLLMNGFYPNKDFF